MIYAIDGNIAATSTTDKRSRLYPELQEDAYGQDHLPV